ncbi:MAG: response regulator [Planctomycetota bacterium]
MAHTPAVHVDESVTEGCENIAYQFTGGVQPHAALLVLEASSGRVLQATSSAEGVLGHAAEDLTGRGLGEVPIFEDDHGLRAILAGGLTEEPVLGPLLRTRHGVELSMRAHARDGLVYLDFEPAAHEGDISTGRVRDAAGSMLALLEETGDLRNAARVTAQFVRERLGYERCMVYKFDETGNGEVVGESIGRDDLEPYLGLRFPSREIPPTVRKMYREERVRVTVDPSEDGAMLVPLQNPRTGEHTDLTHVRTRVTAGPCRRYYRNMGVCSTLILPLIVGDAVWGHIALYHSDRRRPSALLDESLRAISAAFATKLVRLELDTRLRSQQLAIELQTEATGADPRSPLYARRLQEQLPRLRELLTCDAIMLSLGGEFQADGLEVDRELASDIARSLAADRDGRTAHCDHLAGAFPGLADRLGGLAGALVVRVGESWEDHVLALRRAKTQETRWAGDPNAGIEWDKAGRPKLTPRSSFHEYIETTRDRSRPWTDTERMIAESCSISLGLRFLRNQASQSAQAQSAFLANMSHEIRTPMTAILGFAEVLTDRSTSEEERGVAAETIRRNASHLLALVNDILDISKVQAGKMTVEQGPTDAIGLARDVVGLVGPKAADKSVGLELSLDGPVPESIVSDATRVRQILLNLVGNAVKFTDEGRVSVRVTCDPDAELMRFVVNDTGIGMSERQLAQVRKFDVFQQADASMTRRFGGSGLGLNISNSLARLLGGWIDADSTEGRGSTFALTVSTGPLVGVRMVDPGEGLSGDLGESSATSQAAGAARAAGPPAGRALVGFRVLLAEDGPDNQRLIRFYLERAGATVDLASNGLVALQMLGSDTVNPGYDLVLMDMQMPEMDGYTATRRLRELGHTLPVIALTAHAMAGDREKCLGAGCSDYLTKPISAPSLIDAIRGRPRASA